ncbi:hypothetical protein, partial [Streptomyces turgidiscabies]|uniref:hypothetical protein n=1 Tax=Streptomyces turgidiscabies TaxID=85558 RepID=UPI0038F7E88F
SYTHNWASKSFALGVVSFGLKIRCFGLSAYRDQMDFKLGAKRVPQSTNVFNPKRLRRFYEKANVM